MKNNIKSVTYNWHQVGSVQDRDGCGEDWSKSTVGEKGVVLIEEFLAPKWGNLTSYRIHTDDGSSFRTFNPNFVEYSKENDYER